jgi:L-2-hydroxyglutarate oxidase LhgO
MVDRILLDREVRAVDIGVVGAGIVGLTLARALTTVDPASRVTVLEKEPGIGRHQTGHNSGVVHAGLYYQPGSLKARLCSRGRGMMREYCSDKGIAFEEAGKLVVAVDDGEVPGLKEIERRATANGVPGLRWISPAEMTAIEPHVRGVAALHSPHTAVVDFRQVAEAVAEDVQAAGGQVRFGAEVRGIKRIHGRVAVLAGGEVLSFDRLVICAGLQGDRVAAAAGDGADPRIVPFLGMYYRLVPERRNLVRGLIYPVPDARFPFLGVHLTRTVHGEVLVGPNAVLGLAREAYRATGMRPTDIVSTLGWPGFYRLAARYWRAGVHELIGAASRRRFLAAAQRYVPEIGDRDIDRAPLGVRAQAVDRAGRLVDDFALSGFSDVIAVRNAPSPAATSSFAIAEYLTPKVLAGR